MKKLAIFALATIAGASQAAQLYSNGAVTNGVNGADAVSVMTAPTSIFGLGCQALSLSSVADNFTSGNWQVTGFSVFAYQGNSTGFTFTNIAWSIVQGDVNTGTVVASGSSAPGNGGIVGYRVASTAQTLRNRPIYRLNVNGLNLSTGAGNSYWLRYSIDGSLSNGPFAPPVPGTVAGNAQQSLAGGSFSTFVDNANPNNPNFELPFLIHGNVVPEPASMLALSAGIAALVSRRRRK